MASPRIHAVLEQLHKLVGSPSKRRLRDQDLLKRFIAQGDEDAFGELVRKHGSLVLAVCRGVLGHQQDAEDAFQATFLALARKAGSIRKPASLASWLYGVAYRVALKARAQSAKRSAPVPAADVRVQEATPLDDLTWRELREVLHEELNKLPDGYRLALLLCYWEGKTQEEAAQELGWKKGRLRDKLERARSLLRGRLARRGIPCSVMLPAVMLGSSAAQAVPGLVAAETAKAATVFAHGGAASAPTCARAAVWANELLKTMAAAKVKVVTAVLLVASTLAAGVMLLVGQTFAEQGAEQRSDPARASPKEQPPQRAEKKRPPNQRASASKPAVADRLEDPIQTQALALLGSGCLRHGGVVHAVTFDPSGKTLASCGADHSIRLWEAATGKAQGILADPVAAENPYTPARWVYCLAYAPDGKTIAAGEFELGWGQAGAINLWDPATLKHRLRLTGHPGGVKALAFAADSKTLASAGSDQAIRLWDVTTGKETITLMGHGGACNGVAFGQDGKTLVSTGADGTVRMWNLKTVKELWRIEGQSGETGSMVLSRDGKTLASAGTDKSVGLYDPATGKELRRLRLPAKARRIAFSRSGKMLAVACANGTISLWEPTGGRKLRDLKRQNWWDIQSLAFGMEDKILAGSVGAGVVRRWDTATGKEISPPAGHFSPVGKLSFTADGTALLSGGWDWSVRLWEPATRRILAEHSTAWRTAALSRDGKLLSRALNDGTILLVDLRTGKERRRLTGHPGEVTALAFAPNEKSLASAGADNKVRIWDLATGRVIHVLRADAAAGPKVPATQFLAYSPDGQLLATGARGNNRVYVWNLATGKELRLEHTSGVESIRFAPDGHVLAAGDRTGMVTLWDADEGRVTRRLGPHPGYIIAQAFSHDGRTLAVGGWRTIRIWELATGKERTRLAAHYGDVTALAFRPDGRALASGGNDTAILVWDLTGRHGRPRPAKLGTALGRLWSDLGDEDAAKAGKAIWDLVSSPAETVSFLKSRLISQRGPVDGKRLAALIAELDDDDFQVRQRAEKELANLGPRAEAALRKTLAGNPSAEVRGRIDKLLKLLAPDALAPERLRPLRALEVLERIGSPQARQVLQILGKGADGNEVTRQARASLARLTRSLPR